MWEKWILVCSLLIAMKSLCWNVALKVCFKNYVAKHFQGCRVFAISLGPVRQRLNGYTNTHLTQEMPKHRSSTSCQSPPCSLSHACDLREDGQRLTAQKALFQQRNIVGLLVINSHWGKESCLSCIFIFFLFQMCEILCSWHWNIAKCLLTLAL